MPVHRTLVGHPQAGDRVVLVAPPFLRLAGSHNERLPLELAYLQTYLRAAGLHATLLNTDATGASVYRSWPTLFANSPYLAAASHGHSPVLSETLERILSLDPSVVVLSAADNVTPWADTGSPYIAALLAEELRRFGIFTVGVGPFFDGSDTQFDHAFDTLLVGTASPTVVDVIRNRRTGTIVGAPHDLTVVPTLKAGALAARSSVVMTAFGCPQRCSFCFGATQRYRAIPIETVVADVAQRPEVQLEFGDAILPLGRRRLELLINALAPLGRSYSCEISVANATADRLNLLTALGVTSVKLGVESGSDEQLEGWEKRQSCSDALEAAENIKRAGLRLTAYVLLGGPEAAPRDAQRTLELCRRLPADDFVINVAAYHNRPGRNFRDECHFSSSLVRDYGLTTVIDEFFDLQAPVKDGLGALVG